MGTIATQQVAIYDYEQRHDNATGRELFDFCCIGYVPNNAVVVSAKIVFDLPYNNIYADSACNIALYNNNVFCGYADFQTTDNLSFCIFDVTTAFAKNVDDRIVFALSDPQTRLSDNVHLDITYIKSRDAIVCGVSSMAMDSASFMHRPMDGRILFNVHLLDGVMPFDIDLIFDPALPGGFAGMPAGWRLSCVPFLSLTNNSLFSNGFEHPFKESSNNRQLLFSKSGGFLLTSTSNGHTLTDYFGNRIALFEQDGFASKLFFDEFEVLITNSPSGCTINDWRGNCFVLTTIDETTHFIFNGEELFCLDHPSSNTYRIFNSEDERIFVVQKSDSIVRAASFYKSIFVNLDYLGRPVSIKTYPNGIFSGACFETRFERKYLTIQTTNERGISFVHEYSKDLMLMDEYEVKDGHNLLNLCRSDRYIINQNNSLHEQLLLNESVFNGITLSGYGTDGFPIITLVGNRSDKKPCIVINIEIDGLVGNDFGAYRMILNIEEHVGDGILPNYDYSIPLSFLNGMATVAFETVYQGAPITIKLASENRNEPISMVVRYCFADKNRSGVYLVDDASGLFLNGCHWKKTNFVGFSANCNGNVLNISGDISTEDILLNMRLYASNRRIIFYNNNENMLDEAVDVEYSTNTSTHGIHDVSVIDISKASTKLTLLEHDLVGSKIVEVIQNADGTESRYERRYNQQGLLVRSSSPTKLSIFSYSGTKLVSAYPGQSEFHYDNSGRLISVESDAPFGNGEITEYAYDGGTAFPESTNENGLLCEMFNRYDYSAPSLMIWHDHFVYFGYQYGKLIAATNIEWDVYFNRGFDGNISSLALGDVPLWSFVRDADENSVEDLSTGFCIRQVKDEYGRLAKITDGSGNDLYSIFRSDDAHLSYDCNNPLDPQLNYCSTSPVRKIIDYCIDRCDKFQYLEDGKLLSVFSFKYSTGQVLDYEEYNYSDEGLLSAIEKSFGQYHWSCSYEYNEEFDSLNGIFQYHELFGDAVMCPSDLTSDGIGRVSSINYSVSEILVSRLFTYYNSSSYITQINTNCAGFFSTVETIQYGINGKISSCSYNSRSSYFAYDQEGRLLTASMDVGSLSPYSISVSYTNSGNVTQIIRSGTLSSWSRTVTYDNSSRVASINGVQVNYQGGLPTNWYNKSFSWIRNSLLASVTGNGMQANYAYDYEGKRISKTVNGTRHDYYWHGNKLIRETISGDDQHTLGFFYDVSGSICGMTLDGVPYVFVKNVFGDVVRIVDSQGNVVETYSYDPFGVHRFVTSEIGKLNPFRYRGYYYDVETGLYWLSSRYYDPEIGRFISPDSVDYLDPTSINGLNLYAYCNNDPVNYCDPSGHMPEWLAWTLSGAAIIGGIVLSVTGVGGILGGALIGTGAGSLINGYVNETNGGSFTAGYIGGAISGAICAAGSGLGGSLFVAATKTADLATIGLLSAGVGASFAGGFLGNFVGSSVTSLMDRSAVDYGKLALDSTFIGGLNVLAGLMSATSSVAGLMGRYETYLIQNLLLGYCLE